MTPPLNRRAGGGEETEHAQRARFCAVRSIIFDECGRYTPVIHQKRCELNEMREEMGGLRVLRMGQADQGACTKHDRHRHNREFQSKAQKRPVAVLTELWQSTSVCFAFLRTIAEYLFCRAIQEPFGTRVQLHPLPEPQSIHLGLKFQVSLAQTKLFSLTAGKARDLFQLGCVLFQDPVLKASSVREKASRYKSDRFVRGVLTN